MTGATVLASRGRANMQGAILMVWMSAAANRLVYAQVPVDAPSN